MNALFGRGAILLSIAMLWLGMVRSVNAQPSQPVDLNNDGIMDTVRREIRVDRHDPVICRIVVRSGANGSTLAAWPSHEPSDLFGWSVTSMGDLSGDGIEDLAVSAPGSLVDVARDSAPKLKGRVHILSGADGAELLTIANPETTRGVSLGLGLARVPVQDGDGMVDLVVGGARHVPNAPPNPKGEIPVEPVWWVFSSAGWRMRRNSCRSLG